MRFVLISFAAFVGCFVTLSLLLRRAGSLPQDHPNERSLHIHITPRIGGIGIVAGLALASLLQGSAELTVVLLSGFSLALVSLLDDYFDLPPWFRLAMHLLVIALFLAVSFDFFDAWLLMLVMLFALTWMTNLFNFMDGADGLAGGMALFGFAVYACLAWLGGSMPIAMLSAAVSASALAFLFFNFPPARLFMGDAGSVPLGFLSGAVGLLGWRDGLWHWLVPLLVFSPFIVDASVTLVRRGLAREKVWRAHRNHYYQRLVRMGWSHRRLAMVAYWVMAAAAISGVISAIYVETIWGLMFVWCIFYVWGMLVVDRRWRKLGEQS